MLQGNLWSLLLRVFDITTKKKWSLAAILLATVAKTAAKGPPLAAFVGVCPQTPLKETLYDVYVKNAIRLSMAAFVEKHC